MAGSRVLPVGGGLDLSELEGAVLIPVDRAFVHALSGIDAAEVVRPCLDVDDVSDVKLRDTVARHDTADGCHMEEFSWLSSDEGLDEPEPLIETSEVGLDAVGVVRPDLLAREVVRAAGGNP